MDDQPRAQTGRSEAAPGDAGDRRGELVSVLGELYAAGLITAKGGNLSVRIPASQEIWITPAGDRKGGLRADQLVRMRIDSRQPEPGPRRASSEWRVHCAVYQARAEVEAVIHAHAPQATVLALSGLPFLPVTTEAALLGEVGRVPFILPGTAGLAEAAVRALGDGQAVLLQNHGILVAGSSLRSAAASAVVLERTAQIILGCYAVGKEPPTLPAEAIAFLRDRRKSLG